MFQDFTALSSIVLINRGMPKSENREKSIFVNFLALNLLYKFHNLNVYFTQILYFCIIYHIQMINVGWGCEKCNNILINWPKMVKNTIFLTIFSQGIRFRRLFLLEIIILKIAIFDDVIRSSIFNFFLEYWPFISTFKKI